MIDLSTQYLGLKLRTPLVASAGPLCKDVDNVCRLADAGVGAVVLQSLFEEQIDAESNQLDRMLSSGVETYEAQSYFPEVGPRAGYRESEWGFARRLGALRETDAAGGSRCAGTQSI
jgi:dihydroorotate dehydrogenase